MDTAPSTGTNTGSVAKPGGELFTFDREQALAAGQHIDNLAETVRGIVQTSGAQEGAPSLGSDRVSQAVVEILTAQNEVISEGAQHLSSKLQAAGLQFHASGEAVHQTDAGNDRSLTAHTTTGS